MASTIDDAKFYLIDNFPGSFGDNLIPSPSDWTTYGTTENWPVGTKRRVYDETNKGYAILTYLKVTGGTEGEAEGMAAKDICGIVTASKLPYLVSPDGGEIMLNGPIAIALGAVSGAAFTAADQYGWFWTGGVCPVDTIAGLDGNYVTDGNVDAAAGIDMVDNSGPVAFGILDAADVGIPSGFALDADA